jgi:hypothetical protein
LNAWRKASHIKRQAKLEMFLCHHHLVAAFLLGAIECGVGGAQYRVFRLAMLRINSDSQRQGDALNRLISRLPPELYQM